MDEDRTGPGGPRGPEDEQAIPPQFFVWAIVAVLLLVVLLLGAGLPGRFGLPTLALALSTPTPPPTPTVAATPTPRPTLVAPPTPLPTPTVTPTPSPGRFRVANTGGDGAALRSTPSKTGRLILGLPENSIMVEVGPETMGDGVAWRQVRDPRGNVGYMQSQYLVPAPPGG